MTSAMTARCEVHVVIVSYRTADLVIECLKSLADQAPGSPRMSVTVCENASGRDQADTLLAAVRAEGWSNWVTVLPLEKNLGFAGGNNAALREALALVEPPEYFVLLNPDTVVHCGAIAEMQRAMAADPNLGLLGPQIVSDEGNVQNSCFRDHTPVSEFLRAAGTGMLNRLFGRGEFQLAPEPGATDYEWTSFACVMIRREVFADIGLLDDGYFMYYEDCDFCRRARLAGWRIGHCDTARIMHLEGGSGAVPATIRMRRRPAKYFYESRSRYFRRFGGRTNLLLANLCWNAGRVVSGLREVLRTKKPHVCAREWLDIWAGSMQKLPRVRCAASARLDDGGSQISPAHSGSGDAVGLGEQAVAR